MKAIPAGAFNDGVAALGIDEVRRRASFLAGEAEGAIPNGRSIVKVASALKDPTPNGTKGVVLASHYVDGLYFYFVEFEDKRGIPIGLMGWKIGELT